MHCACAGLERESVLAYSCDAGGVPHVQYIPVLNMRQIAPYTSFSAGLWGSQAWPTGMALKTKDNFVKSTVFLKSTGPHGFIVHFNIKES